MIQQLQGYICIPAASPVCITCNNEQHLRGTASLSTAPHSTFHAKEDMYRPNDLPSLHKDRREGGKQTASNNNLTDPFSPLHPQ
ncbi:hypothetical protein IAQ61_010248 [Plenodomus lingam]|uniref:Predicted protein n=1 Tax=Leptosphaeria maculans (strain JN3 / isolate v23.1.3 / race Av1-4-5-6-7-8) TaxID=985895 RepID=E5A3D4_LEPMJ|nr:predicted protein [Plenodomus lingam JN3]KAH9862046.1 hypothetical protein IAQ61_010248 [Plenodomus lingam]CBX98147.1 predicted protein [Plenodomus lingam JN3]